MTRIGTEYREEDTASVEFWIEWLDRLETKKTGLAVNPGVNAGAEIYIGRWRF
jgi:hypothetical protein